MCSALLGTALVGGALGHLEKWMGVSDAVEQREP